MRFFVIVNNDEALDAGDDPSIEETEYEISELLRSGYYAVESMEALLK